MGSRVTGSELFDEGDETGGLSFEAFDEFGLVESVLRVEQIVDLRQKDAFGIEVSVAVGKQLLQLFDRAQGAPGAGREPDETDRPALQAFGELQHVDEIFEDTGEPAVVFGTDDDQAGGIEDRLGETLEGGGFLRVGGRSKQFRGQFGEIQPGEVHSQIGIDTTDFQRYLQGIAARSIGANDERDHAAVLPGFTRSTSPAFRGDSVEQAVVDFVDVDLAARKIGGGGEMEGARGAVKNQFNGAVGGVGVVDEKDDPLWFFASAEHQHGVVDAQARESQHVRHRRSVVGDGFDPGLGRFRL